MGLAAAIKGRWFGPSKADAPKADPPKSYPHPWTLHLLGATGSAPGFLSSSVVDIPAATAGTVTAVTLTYGDTVLMVFALDAPRPVAAGDVIRFDLFASLRATNTLARFGDVVKKMAVDLA